MLRYFPMPYPNENVYSIFVRYDKLTGNNNYFVTAKELMGQMNLKIKFSFANNLEFLRKELPQGTTFTPEYFILNHTVLPIYKAFIPKERYEQAVKNLSNGSITSALSAIGYTAGSVFDISGFKYCPECIKEDTERYGELYWNRTHQISGVFVCPKHEVLLQDSKVLVRGFNKQEYVAATVTNCNNNSEITNITDDMFYKFNLISQDIEALLNSKYQNREIECFRNQYINILIDKGLANVNEKIKQKELLNSFVDYYGDNLLFLLQSSIDIHSDQNWLTDLVRRKNKTTHPIRHLLLSRFLGVSIDDLFNKEISYKPFGDGPWHCLNPVASHYKELVIKDIEIKYSVDSKKTVGIFKCGCGFHYMRTDNDKDENDKFEITKVKAFGPVWEDRLREVIEEKLSLRMTAKQLQVDPATIKKYAKKLGLYN